MTIQGKVTFLFIALTSSVILLLSEFIFLYVHHFAFEDFYKRLETRLKIAEAIHYHKENQKSIEAKKLRKQYLEKLPSEQEYYIPQYGNVERAFYSLSLPKSIIRTVINNKTARYQEDNQFYVAKLHKDSSIPTIVIVTAKDPYGLEELDHLRSVLIIGFIVSIGIVYFVGKLFSKHTFEPFRLLSNRVQSLTAQDLSLRLQTPGSNDEISRLTETFNEMLTRLETSFKIQNNFISNASHELRTPLTIIQGETELVLKKGQLTNQQTVVLQTILVQTKKLTSIIDSLLGMAQTGFDGKKQEWNVLRMDEVILEAKENLDKLYPDNQIVLDFSNLPDEEDLIKIHGNSNLIRLAISNILINACKYSNNQIVRVTLHPKNKFIYVEIEDQGIGIPSKEMAEIFEPFFRASNTVGYSGHGVGLPLALNIVKLHKGNIKVNSTIERGTHIEISIPIA